MNRTRHLISVIALVMLAFVQTAVADIPRSISYQGRLTDNLGSPLTGMYTITFRIYDAAVGGATLYNSGGTSVTATDGLFSVNIGEAPMPAISVSVFADTTRYLGITVGADPEMTPRSKLTSVGYAFVVRTIDGATGGDVTGTVNVRNSSGSLRGQILPSASQMSTFGTDDLEQARLWGGSWGELLLYDIDGTNDQTVRLSSQSSFASDGGILELNNDDGSPNISLHAGTSGDGSVVLPNNAIRDFEILDEPGVASQAASSTNLSGTATVLSRTITAPASGYLVAMATGTFDLSHVTGTIAQNEIWLTNDPGGFAGGNPSCRFTMSGNAPSGTYIIPYGIQGIFPVSAGATTIYLRGTQSTGTGIVSAADNDMILMFFPTAYGTVLSYVPSNDPNEPIISTSAPAGNELTGDAFTQRRLAYEVEQLKAQLAEIRAKMGNTDQSQVAESNK